MPRAATPLGRVASGAYGSGRSNAPDPDGAGGTSLTAGHTTGVWQAETAFGLADGTAGSSFQASGGGFSRLFSRPGYQDGRTPGTGSGSCAA
jgi:hypothetical protein